MEHGDCEAEIVIGASFDADGDAAGEDDGGAVGDEAGLVVDDFVAGVEDGTEGDIDGFGDADGDEDFVEGVVVAAEMLCDVGGDGLAEAEFAAVGGIVGGAAFDGEEGGLTDIPWGIEIGLTDAEGDDIFLGSDDIEEASDTGEGEGTDAFCDGGGGGCGVGCGEGHRGGVRG